MKKYRTDEQWKDICDSIITGNWQEAGQSCVDGGFWANDMINKFNDESFGLEPTDLAILSELAMEKRVKE